MHRLAVRRAEHDRIWVVMKINKWFKINMRKRGPNINVVNHHNIRFFNVCLPSMLQDTFYTRAFNTLTPFLPVVLHKGMLVKMFISLSKMLFKHITFI